MKPFKLALSIAAILLFGSASPSPVAANDVAPAAPFTVSIVPSHSDEYGQGINFSDDNPDAFYVVLTNTSKETQPAWVYHYSWGYQNISFELTTADGKKFTITKRDQDFTKNGPATFLVPSGEHRVYAIRLNKEWKSSLKFSETGSMPITLKACYDIDPTEESAKYKVWTGHIESKAYKLVLRHW